MTLPGLELRSLGGPAYNQSGSGFPSNATLFWIFYSITATCFGRMTIFKRKYVYVTLPPGIGSIAVGNKYIIYNISKECYILLYDISKSKLLYDWRSVSQSVCLGVGHPFGAYDKILLIPFFCRKIALLFVLGRPLWREDGSVICSAIYHWSELRRPHDHTLLTHLRLLGSFPSALTTRRDYGGSILKRLHTGNIWHAVFGNIQGSSSGLRPATF
jgi:hypothetical protein